MILHKILHKILNSEETATAFTVSQSSHNSRTKLQFANPRIKIQENVARSLQKLLVFVALQPLSSYSWNRHTHTQTHTRSALPYPSCGYASRHNQVYTVLLITTNPPPYVVMETILDMLQLIHSPTQWYQHIFLANLKIFTFKYNYSHIFGILLFRLDALQ